MRMMIGFLRKALVIQVRFSLSVSASSSSSTPPHIQIQTLPFLFHQHLNTFSSSSSSEAHLFTFSLLINSYGFSHKQALSASKYISFKNPEKPNLVYAFFYSHGFSESQISKIIRSKPRLLLSNPLKCLLPKLQFFYSKGASKPEVAKIVATCPTIMKKSLENQIIPYFNFLEGFFESQQMAMACVKRFPRALIDYPHCVESNIKALQVFGVPKSNIVTLLSMEPMTLMATQNHFRKVLEEVKEMGFDPSKKAFTTAVQGMRGMSKSTWEGKIDAFRSWGWSEEDIRLLFLKLPWTMMRSKDKIMATMDFFVNKMGMKPSIIAHRPMLVSLSLEKRIIPRYSVVHVLLSKGLIKEDFSLRAVFESREKVFLHKFVNTYKEEAPQLLNLYQEMVNNASAGSHIGSIDLDSGR